MRRLSTTVIATAAAVLLGASAASAVPDHEVFPLVCDDGNTYEVLVHGNGAFTPGRLVGGGGVIVPVSIGDFEFEAVLPDGTVLTESDPGVLEKGKGAVGERNPRPLLTCTFEITEVLEEADGDLPAGTTVTFSGSATGYLSGRG